MDRRNFLKTSGAILALLSIPSSGGSETVPNPAKDSPRKKGISARVSLAGVSKGASVGAIQSAVRAAAQAASDFSWLSRGDTVFIKPVVNSGRPYPATTSPIAIAAMIELLREKGARRVIAGDMGGIAHVKLTKTGLSGSSRRLMETSGMAQAVLAAGGELHFFEESGWGAFYEEAPAAGSHWKRGLTMPNILKEVDHIVLMPRCGRHILAGSTLGLKAAVGYWRTDTRLEYHQDAATFQEKTAEGNTVATLQKKQRLTISAADKLLTTFGPDEGYVFEPKQGLVIASESVVAHDMVSLAWLLENRTLIPSGEKDILSDPYNSQLIVRLGNSWVVGKLGGWKSALFTEKLTRHDIVNIWDDRVLNRAYNFFGGIPQITLVSADNTVTDQTRGRLIDLTTYKSY